MNAASCRVREAGRVARLGTVTTHGHVARDKVGWSSWKNCTLEDAVVEVCSGRDLTNAPQNLSGVWRSQVQKQHLRVSCLPPRGC